MNTEGRGDPGKYLLHVTDSVFFLLWIHQKRLCFAAAAASDPQILVIRTHIHTDTHIYTYTQSHTHGHTYTQTHTHTQMDTHIYTDTHR